MPQLINVRPKIVTHTTIVTLRRKRKWSSSLALLSFLPFSISFPLSPTDRPSQSFSQLSFYRKNEGIGTTVMISMILREISADLRYFGSLRARARNLRFRRVESSSRFRDVTIKKKKKEELEKKKGRRRKEKKRSVIDRVDIEATNTPPSCQLADWRT